MDSYVIVSGKIPSSDYRRLVSLASCGGMRKQNGQPNLSAALRRAVEEGLDAIGVEHEDPIGGERDD